MNRQGSMNPSRLFSWAPHRSLQEADLAGALRFCWKEGRSAWGPKLIQESSFEVPGVWVPHLLLHLGKWSELKKMGTLCLVASLVTRGGFGPF